MQSSICESGGCMRPSLTPMELCVHAHATHTSLHQAKQPRWKGLGFLGYPIQQKWQHWGKNKRGLPKPQRRPCLAFSKLYTAFSQCFGRLLRPSEAWQEGSQDLENNAYGLKKAWSSQHLPCIGSNWVQLSSSRKRRQQKSTEEVEWLGLGWGS